MRTKMNSIEKRNLVLSGNLYKVILFLALPIMFNNLMKTLYNLVDTFWVAKISGNDLEVSAIGVIWPIQMLVIAIGLGFYIAGTSLMSQHIGANEKEKAEYIASQLFSFAFFLGIFMMIVGYIYSPLILRYMELDSEVYKLSLSYLQIILLETPLVFCLLIFTAMRQAAGDTITPVIFTVISLIINIGLDPVFIIVLRMGVSGVAIATVLAKVVVLPFWLYMVFFDKNSIHVTFKHMKLKLSSMKQFTLVAIPASLSQTINALGFVVLNKYITSFGNLTMAAFNVGNRINSLIMMPALGIGSALAFVVGQNIGALNYQRAREAFKKALILTLIIMLLSMALILPYQIRKLIVGLFLNEAYTIALALDYMIFIGINTPLMGLYQNYSGVFLGSGKTVYSFLLSLTRLWGIRIPLIIYFKYCTDFGNSGIWYAMVISNIIVCLLGTILYIFGKWERKIV